MESGIADRVWTIEGMVKLMEPKSILDRLFQTALRNQL
jgi:hypothetical protein